MTKTGNSHGEKQHDEKIINVNFSQTNLRTKPMSLSQNLIKVESKHAAFIYIPQSLSELMKYAEMIALSSFCPKDMRNKPSEIIIAMQYGAEIGLNPLQSLQNITVINGRPCIWGDLALAVVQVSPAYIAHREWYEGDIKQGDLTAYCGITRKNSDEYVKSFSQQDAKTARLWTKEGVWQQYPSRMLQMRARGFCIRDKFADALKGLSIREEVEDYHDDFIKKPESKVVNISTRTVDLIQFAEQPVSDEFVENIIEDFNLCKTIEELTSVFMSATKDKALRSNRNQLNKVIQAKNKKKVELQKPAKPEIEDLVQEYETVEVSQ